MYVCVHVHVAVCVCMCMYVHVYAVFVCVWCVYICTNVLAYTCVYLYVCAYMHVCLYISMYACVLYIFYIMSRDWPIMLIFTYYAMLQCS